MKPMHSLIHLIGSESIHGALEELIMEAMTSIQKPSQSSQYGKALYSLQGYKFYQQGSD